MNNQDKQVIAREALELYALRIGDIMTHGPNSDVGIKQKSLLTSLIRRVCGGMMSDAVEFAMCALEGSAMGGENATMKKLNMEGLKELSVLAPKTFHNGRCPECKTWRAGSHTLACSKVKNVENGGTEPWRCIVSDFQKDYATVGDLIQDLQHLWEMDQDAAALRGEGVLFPKEEQKREEVEVLRGNLPPTDPPGQASYCPHCHAYHTAQEAHLPER